MFRILIASLVLISSTVISVTALGQSSSNDFGETDSKKEILTAKEIRKRFELHGEIYVTDKKGKLLYKDKESRIWKFGGKGDLVSNWSSKTPGRKEVALSHTWKLSDDGNITGEIHQYDTLIRKPHSRDVKVGKLIREEKITLSDFQPINWIAQNDNERVIVRLTPKLSDQSDAIDVKGLPVALKDPVIFDNKGRLWGVAKDLEGQYVGFKTHMGSVAVSYAPFKGAKEIGFVQGNEMTIQAQPELTIYMRSQTPILTTTSPAKIYGYIDTNSKSEGVNSVYSSSSSEEKQFLDGLKAIQ